MIRVLLLVAAVGAVGMCAYTGARLAGWRPQTRALTDGAADPAGYRNHLAMARLIEAVLDDEMVRPLLPEEHRVRGRRLLEEFYGEEDA